MACPQFCVRLSHHTFTGLGCCQLTNPNPIQGPILPASPSPRRPTSSARLQPAPRNVSGLKNDALTMSLAACILCSLGTAAPEWDGLRSCDTRYRIAGAYACRHCRHTEKAGLRHAGTRRRLELLRVLVDEQRGVCQRARRRRGQHAGGQAVLGVVHQAVAGAAGRLEARAGLGRLQQRDLRSGARQLPAAPRRNRRMHAVR